MSAFIAEKYLEKIKNHVLHVAQRATNSSFTIAGLQRITMFRKNFLVLLHKLVFRIFTPIERKFLL
ncbi:hypothetical protein BFS16_09575 [Hoylesella timonensis]|uniref:Uncharacterized protein n=1 Tax=Hoylesella timonensis TaxID=386414 RepID=A0A2K0XF62_9BACT|nr:hypothetical protein BFS16_09575 [Hoylesella timonensis]